MLNEFMAKSVDQGLRHTEPRSRLTNDEGVREVDKRQFEAYRKGERKITFLARMH